MVTRAVGPTVGDALAALGIAPVGLDYTIPPQESPLEPDMLIRLVRVTEEVITEREPIPFTTERQPDPTLKAGEERVIQAGADGVRERQIRVTYEDGQPVRRDVQHEQILEPAVPRLIAYGPAPTKEN